MTAIWQSVELQRLGWLLLHSLWQGAAICALAAALLRLLRHKSPQHRYVVACCALGTLVLAAVGTGFYLMGEPISFSVEVAANSITQPKEGAAAWLMGAIPKLPIIWAVGVLVFSARLLGGWYWLRRSIRIGVCPAPAEWRWRSASLSRAMGMAGRVKVLVSSRLRSPMAIGWIKPLVLLPASALLHLPSDALEAILAHELAHIRRRDFLVNLVQSAIEVLFFYHPAAWWLSRQIRELREHCCDDEAAKLCGGAADYASALAELETLRGGHATPQLAHAANGASLMARIQRLLSISQPVSVGVRAGLIAAALLSMVGAGALWGFSVEAQQKLERQRIIIKDGSKSLDVNIQGDVKLDPGSKNGFALGEGASLRITEKGGGPARRLDMKQEDSGVKVIYHIDGREVPLDTEGEAWLKVQIKEIQGVEVRKSSLAPNGSGAIQFEIAEDGKDGAGSKVIVYSNGRSPIILDGQPVLMSSDLSSLVEAMNKTSPEEIQRRAEQARKHAEEAAKQLEAASKRRAEVVDARMNPEEIQKLAEQARKRAEEAAKQLEYAKIADEFRRQADEIMSGKQPDAKRAEEFRKLAEEITKRSAVDTKQLEEMKKRIAFFQVFPAESGEDASVTPEAKKQRIEEELKRAKARVEQLEEELKKSEAK